jgi:hypothetical protein
MAIRDTFNFPGPSSIMSFAWRVFASPAVFAGSLVITISLVFAGPLVFTGSSAPLPAIGKAAAAAPTTNDFRKKSRRFIW